MRIALPWTPFWTIALFSVVASLCLSVSAFYRVDVINPDAICYLYSAAQAGKAPFSHMLSICPQAKWPFYSALIALFSHSASLSLTQAAFLIDGIFSALTVFFFIAIVHCLNPARRLLGWAAFTILLAHTFNTLRLEIIRDHGFWCCYLMLTFWALQWVRAPSLNRVIWIYVSLIGATLFRIEGACFFLLLPGLAWCVPNLTNRARLKYFLLINLPWICVLAGFLVMRPVGRLAEINFYLSHGVSMLGARYVTISNAIYHHVLPLSGLRDVQWVTVLLLLSAYLVNVIDNLSIGYSLLFLYGVSKRLFKTMPGMQAVLFWLVAINVLVTFMFYVEHLFLARRYLVALSLTLMLFVPFSLDALCKWHTARARAVTVVVVAYLVLSVLGGFFHFGTSKKNIRYAGAFLSRTVPMQATLYANDYQLMYYSNHFGEQIFETWDHLPSVTQALKRVPAYQYLALRLNEKEQLALREEIAQSALQLVGVFKNQRGDDILIYKKREERS